MRDSNGNIFVSYRKDTSTWQALAVYYALKEVHHRSIWMDRNLVPGENWRETIFANLRASTHFVLILAHKSLDRCRFEDDFFKEEIILAIEKKRNIVPLFFNFEWGKEKRELIKNNFWYRIPKQIRNLSDIEGKSISLKGFTEEIETLNSYSLASNVRVKTEKVLKPFTDTLLTEATTSVLTFSSPIPQSSHINIGSSLDLISDSDYFGGTADFLGIDYEHRKKWLENNIIHLSPNIQVYSTNNEDILDVEVNFFPESGLGTAFYVSITNTSAAPINISDITIIFDSGEKISYKELTLKYIQLSTPLPNKLNYTDNINYLFPLHHMREISNPILNPTNFSGVEIRDTLGNKFTQSMTKEEKSRMKDYWDNNSW